MQMNRRKFLRTTGTLVSAGMLGCTQGLAVAKDPKRRIAMTTVTFRARFAQTRIENHPPVEDLTLLDVPEFYADRFGVHNLEFWSRHFASLDAGYLKQLRQRMARAKSKLINIQIDERYNLADSDEAARQKSLDLVKQWIDAAVALGAPSARANTGRGDINICIRSFKELNQYAKEKGVLLLTENHGGLSSDPDNLLQIHAAVNSPNFEILADFGNFSADIQMEALRKILPRAKHLISAKAKQFDEKWNHTLYDFDQCMRLARASGFPGYYSAEYYDGRAKPVDYEKVADWMIEHIQANL